MAEKKSFMIYMDWEELVEALGSDEQAGELFKALFAFAKRGETPHLEGALKMAFLMMSAQIARDRAKWEDTCRKRSAAGKKSGVSRGNKTADSSSVRTNACFDEQNEQNEQNEQKLTNQTDTDTDTDTDTETETDIETGTGADTDTETDTDIETGTGADTVTESDTDTDTGTDTDTDNAPNGGTLSRAERTPSARYTKNRYDRRKRPRVSEDKIIAEMKEEFGSELTERYLCKVEDYCTCMGKDYANKAVAARRWLREDIENGKCVLPKKSSFDTEKLGRIADEFDPWEELKKLEEASSSSGSGIIGNEESGTIR